MKSIKPLFFIVLGAASIVVLTHLVFDHTQNFTKYLRYGKYLFDTKHYAQAEGPLKGALRFQPCNREALDYLLWIYEKEADQKKRHRHLEQMWQCYPEDRDIALMLADSYFALAEHQKAKELFLRLLEGEETHTVRRKLVDIALATRDWDMALTHLSSIVNATEATFSDRMLEAQLYTWKKDYSKALTVYAKLRDAYPETISILLKMADTYRYAGDDDVAQALYEEYLERSDDE